METINGLLMNGAGQAAIGYAVMRFAVGSFFAISGFHKLFNAPRHATLCATLKSCGVPCIGFFQWFVPGVEFLAGMAVATGFLTPLAALGLICICLIAILTDGLKRIPAWKPIDRADYADDVLYLPEVLYLVMLAVVVATGAGPFSLDAIGLQLLGT